MRVCRFANVCEYVCVSNAVAIHAIAAINVVDAATEDAISAATFLLILMLMLPL